MLAKSAISNRAQPAWRLISLENEKIYLYCSFIFFTLPLTCHLPGRESRPEELNTVRIPLDYYRILSVPVKATSEQLKQAYSDRLLQQPRREYTERAIAARQKLLESSYRVLSDIEQRANYDAQFLVNMEPIETTEPPADRDTETSTMVKTEEMEMVPLANPTIEIPPAQLVGALLILHELGEYETVLKIGIDYFNFQLERGGMQATAATGYSDGQDLILAIALAYLEVGREQWQRQEYENAAVSGQMGIDLLNRQNLFPHLREELELDLHKLRPYRVLELISQNPIGSAERDKGFQLLRSMLIQRRGIEGKGSDRSGLNFDRFLCFIQQLRTYLTSAEQQQLFDDKSQKDSAIANYLAVYALLGRGFSLKQPELIIRAQRKLDSLSEKQDVSWEQTVAALLLGHTEKAIGKLQQASDTSKLEMVRQHGVDSSDLLPGLCFYSELWLLEEVVAQFSDLLATRLTLKEYFADRQVQAYLNELAPPKIEAVKTSQSKTVKHSLHEGRSQTTAPGFWQKWRKLFSLEAASAKLESASKVSQAERELVGVTGPRSLRDKVSRSATTVTGARRNRPPNDRQGDRKTFVPSSNLHHQPTQKSPSLPLQPTAKSRAVPPAVIHKAQSRAKQKLVKKRRRTKATLWKGWLFIFSWILGGASIGYVAMKLFLPARVNNANRAQLAIAISQPAVEIPLKETKPVAAKVVTFEERAQQTIQSWLDSKSAAFGKQHQIERLDSILAEPLLTTWRDRALAYQQGQFYREYEHQLTVRSAKVNPQDENKATIEAEVKEVAQHYQSGQLDETQSYDDNLLVRYQLLRRGDKWLIRDSEVLKTLE